MALIRRTVRCSNKAKGGPRSGRSLDQAVYLRV